MLRWIAFACVLGWAFFAVFGYLALSSLGNPGFPGLIAAELALYGLAIGCMTWAYVRSELARRRNAQRVRSVIDR